MTDHLALKASALLVTGAGVSGLALATANEAIGLWVTAGTGVVMVIVWLVRLEGRLNTLAVVNELQHQQNQDRLNRIARAVGIDE